MKTDFEFNEAMNQVSGYGGDYERACRLGVHIGASWFADHIGATPEFGSWPKGQGQVKALNLDALSLLSSIEMADFIREDGTHVPLLEELTPEMTQMILYHVLYIAKHGWNQYVAKMSAPVSVVEETE